MNISHLKVPKVVTSPEDFASELVNNPQVLKREVRYIRNCGVDLPVRILDIPENGAVGDYPIVFSFHGGVSEDRSYPYFFGHRFSAQDNASARTVLALCDPTLAIPGNLKFGWYAGYEGVDVPQAIHTLLNAVVTAANPSRTILVGGSTGAHAALRHVGAFPGALFFGINPLPRISKYWRPAVKKYFETCWPEQFDAQTLTCPQVIDDASDIYAGIDTQNTFLFVQNPTDPHAARQAIPMLEKLTRHPNMAPRTMALMPYWADSTGHTAPKGLFERWVEATITSSSLDPSTIALTYEHLEDHQTLSNQVHQMNPRSNQLDRTLAKVLADSSRTKAI